MEKFNRIKKITTKNINKATSELLIGVPLITQIGNKKIIIENYKNILGFLEYEVKIATNIGTMKVYGEKMIMTEMTSETIIIIGDIIKVEIIK